MSHFFQDLSISKKVKNISLDDSSSEEDSNMITKEIEKARKSNNIEQFFKNMKKYKKQLKKEIPKEIEDYLNELQNNNKYKAKINKFYTDYKKPIKKDSKEEYNIKDTTKATESADKNINKNKGESVNLVEKISKINLNFNNTDIKDIIEILEMIEIEDKKTEKVVDILLSRINNKIKKDDKEIIDLLENKYNKIKDKNNRRYLEYKYFIRGENVETNDKHYKILYFIRNENYEEAKNTYKNIIENDSNKIDNRILKELGCLAFKEKDLFFSYKILTSIFIEEDFKNEGINNIDKNFAVKFNKTVENLFSSDNVIKILYSLCILLDDKLLDSEVFKYFLQDYRSLGDNILLLESTDSRMELLRAYFYYRNYNYKNSSKIIEKIVNVDFEDYLKDRIYARIKV